MPAGIGLNQCGKPLTKLTLVQVVRLCHFTSLPSCSPVIIPQKASQLDFAPVKPRLTAYNGSNIPQFGVLDTAIEWTPKCHQHSKHLQTRWYVADSPGPAILGLPSSIKTGNYAAELWSQTHLQT